MIYKVRHHVAQLATIGVVVLWIGTASKVDAQFTPIPRADSGFLFLNEEYIPPPYAIEIQDETTILINGFEVEESTFDLTTFVGRSRKAGGSGGPRRRFRGREAGRASSRLSRFHQQLIAALNKKNGGLIILSVGLQPAFIPLAGGEVLDLLVCLNETVAENRGLKAVSSLASNEHEACSKLIEKFETTPDFSSRSSKVINDMTSIQLENEKVSERALMAAAFAYPLTVFAMVVVVLGFGHLLSNSPVIGSLGTEDAQGSHAKRIVCRSLVIVGMLSIVDLVWTLTASQTGAMRELNPLGSLFIHSPQQLILFKGIGVCSAIAILYILHERPVAQAASWWSCLVLTLLTARWLTFNSIFL